MDKAVPLHEAAAERPHSRSQTGQSWSDFFQALGQGEGGDTLADVLAPANRFATSA